MQSKYLSNECEHLHRLIDKGKQIFIDEDYARLLNRFENVFDKFVEMSNKLELPISADLIKKYKDLRNKFDYYDSYCVVSHLEHYKMSTPREQEDIKDILFEDDNKKTQNACCDEKCIIF